VILGALGVSGDGVGQSGRAELGLRDVSWKTGRGRRKGRNHRCKNKFCARFWRKSGAERCCGSGREGRERTEAGGRGEKREIGKNARTRKKGGEEAREISVERGKRNGEKCASFGEREILGRQLRVVFRGRGIKGNFEVLKEKRVFSGL